MTPTERYSNYRLGWLAGANGSKADRERVRNSLDYREGWVRGRSARRKAFEDAMARYSVKLRDLKPV